MTESRHIFSRPAFVLVVGIASLFGGLVGGGIVYLAVNSRLASPSIQAPIQIRSQTRDHIEAEGVRTVDVQSGATKAVGKVGSAVEITYVQDRRTYKTTVVLGKRIGP